MKYNRFFNANSIVTISRDDFTIKGNSAKSPLILEICKKYGEIEKSPLIVKRNKGSLAYAIIAFKSFESAKLAIEGLISDYGLQVDYAVTKKNPFSYSKVSGFFE